MATAQVRRKLSVQFIAVTLSLTALMALLVTGLQIYIAYNNEVKQLHSRLNLIEQSYSSSLADSLWSIDLPRINMLLDGISRLPGVGKIVLTDDVGQQWQRGAILDDSVAQRAFTLKITIDGEAFTVGTLAVWLTAADIYQSLQTKALAIAITSGLSLLVTAIILLYLFRHAISRHLENMAGYAASIDGNNLERPLRLKRPSERVPDELDLVVDAINKMRLNILEDLNRREKIELELIHHREHLEALVSERTLALQQSNQVLAKQSAELVEQNTELNAYAHTVAHDLKHPLTALLGQTALLKGAASALTESQRMALMQDIHHSADKMNNIINALLMLASVRRNDSVKTTEIDVFGVAAEAHRSLQHFASERHASINFTADWPHAIGFAPWIEQVWVNYLSNAIKYGGDTPHILLGADALPDGMNKYWIQDKGPGIAPSQQAELFTQFGQLDTKQPDSHGLGLSIVKRIINRLGGEVGYQSQPQGGSLFWFSLPALQ